MTEWNYRTHNVFVKASWGHNNFVTELLSTHCNKITDVSLLAGCEQCTESLKLGEKDLEWGAVYNMSGVPGNLTTCGNVAASVWVAAQHAITIFLMAHLAQRQKTEHTAGSHHVTKFSKALKKNKKQQASDFPRESWVLGEIQQSASVSEWLCWILNREEYLTTEVLPPRLHFHPTIKILFGSIITSAFFGNFCFC